MPEVEAPAPAIKDFWQDSDAVGKPVDLLAFFEIYLGRWPFLAGMAFLGFALAFGISLLLTPRFVSQVVFLPPAQQAGAGDNPLSLFLRAPSSAVYEGLLGSESVVAEVVRKTNLQSVLKAKDEEDARDSLRRMTSISSSTAGFVTVQVTNRDKMLARDIAGAYLDALTHLNNRLALGQAVQNRELFQSELEHAKDQLEASEVALKRAQEASGVVSAESQTRSGLSAIDQVRADIRAKQVARAAMLQSQTEQSPEVQRMEAEISNEEGQLSRLESGGKSAPGSGLSAAEAPSVNLRFVQLEREVKYNQVLFDVMAKQYENARLAESSAAPGVQIVDYPEIPARKSWPSRRLFATTGAVGGLLLALAIVFVWDRGRVLMNDPTRAESLRSLTRSLIYARMRP